MVRPRFYPAIFIPRHPARFQDENLSFEDIEQIIFLVFRIVRAHFYDNKTSCQIKTKEINIVFNKAH